jgi:hypothetical protein
MARTAAHYGAIFALSKTTIHAQHITTNISLSACKTQHAN